MNFLILEDLYKKWKEILVIGKTIERNNKKYHLIGMTLSEKENEAKLYIIEPYIEPKQNNQRKKGIYNQRKILKEYEEIEHDYLNCSEFKIGDNILKVQGGFGGCLKYSLNNYGEIQIFFDMINAGWVIPEWLKEEEWENLQLVTLDIVDIESLPKYSKEMPITITHHSSAIQHIVEKTITLDVGKKRNFSFIDNYGDKVQCYINNVTLIDMWKDMEERFNNPEYKKLVSQEQLEEMKKMSYEALECSCPKGMCYIGVEYECSKDISLQFYSKEFLKSLPKQSVGSSSVMGMVLKSDKKTGIHNLPLKGCAIQTAVSKDTTKIPAELFSYLEKVQEWIECI